MMFWSLHLPRPFALSFLDVGDVVSGVGREHVPDDTTWKSAAPHALHGLTDRFDSLSLGKM
jgi:hypothetical protein